MKWLVAYVSGIASSVIMAVCLGFLFNGLHKNTAFTSLTAGLMVAIFIVVKYSNLSSGVQKKDLGFWSWATIIIFVLFSLRSFLWLIFKRGDSIQVLCANNLGDMPYHINYIQYFANGAPFWPSNPICTGEKIHYHFGLDLFNSLLVLLGMDLIKSLVWVGLVSSIATGFALLTWGRAFTLGGFLFNGGIAGFNFFQTLNLTDYQRALDWENIPLVFIPQRALLYALPAGLLLLTSWQQRFFRNEEKSSKLSLPLWIEVLLYSSMPIFHIHTFIFLSMLLGIWILILSWSKRVQILRLIGFSFPLACFFIAFLTDFLKKGGMIHIDLEYLQSINSFLKFWIFNFGIFWPLVIWLCIELIFKKREQEAGFFVFPGVVLFVFFSLVIMSSWKHDNIKLLLWSYIILLPYLWKNLISHWDKFNHYVVCFVLFFSGFICVVSSFDVRRSHEIFKLSEVREVASVVQKLPLENRFAAYPTYNHPLSFCGRKIVLGYPGWLWVHGFAYGETEEKLKKVMLGDPEWQKLAKELGVRYIFWGEREKHEYTMSTMPWVTKASKLFDGTYCQIYDLGQI